MRTARALLIALALTAGTRPRATAQVEMQPVEDPSLRDYYNTIAAQFKITPKEVQLVRQQQIRDEQIAVVLFIAQQANVASKVVAELRLSGADFISIASRYKLGADVFHFPVTTPVGKPYQQAYAPFDRTPREKWNKILLTDEAAINLVNLRMLVEQHHCPPEKVMNARANSRNFIEINQQLAASTPPHG